MSLLLALLLQASVEDRLKADPARAVEELSALPDSKADLERLAASADPDLSWWAKAALEEMAERGRPGYVPPRRVTLDAKDRSAVEVLKELLGTDAAFDVNDLTVTEAKVSVSLRDVPLQRALDEICRRSGLALERHEDGVLRVVHGSVPEEPEAYVPFQAVRLTSVTHRTRAQFAGEPERSTELRLSVVVDPRLVLRVAENRWEFASARDERGRELKLAQNTCRSYSRGPAPVHQVQATFESVPADATRIASLRGFVLLPVYQSPEVVWFDVRPEAGEQTRESGPLKLKCSRMNRLRGCWSVALTLEPKDFPGAPEAKELALEDAQGAPFGMSSGSWGGGMVTAQFGAVADRVPVRLRVTTYPDCRFRRVAFELKDIALR